MPISFVVDKERGRVHTTVTDAVSVNDVLDHFATIQRERVLPMVEVIDARQAGTPYMTPDNLWHLAGAISGMSVEQLFGPRAVVVDNLTKFGLVRIFAQLLSGHISMNVFRDLESAEEWLSLQPQPYRHIKPLPQ